MQLGDQGGLAVVAQPAGMDAGRHEVVPQSVHHGNGRHLGGISVVKGIDPFGQGRAGGRFHGHAAHILAGGPVGDKGKGQPGEVGATAAAGDDHVRVVAGDLHLLPGLLADHGLMQADVVEHAPQGVVGVAMGGGVLHRLGDGHSQRARAFRVVGQDGAPRIGEFRGGGDDLGAPQLHHALAVGLLGAGDLDHVDRALKAEQGAGQGQGAAPLAGAGLGGQAADAGLLVVPRLGDGRVGLVGAGRRDSFELIVDPGRGAERLFQAMGAIERRRPPELVDLPDLVRDVDPAVGGHLLLDQRHGEDGQHVVRGERFEGLGIDDRRQGTRHVGDDVVPLPGDLVFAEKNFGIHVVSPELKFNL